MKITVNYKKYQENLTVHTPYNRYVDAFDWRTGDTFIVPEIYATQSQKSLEWYVKDGLETSFLQKIAL